MEAIVILLKFFGHLCHESVRWITFLWWRLIHIPAIYLPKTDLRNQRIHLQNQSILTTLTWLCAKTQITPDRHGSRSNFKLYFNFYSFFWRRGGGGGQIQLFQQQNVDHCTLLSGQEKGNKKHVCWIDYNHLLDHCLIQQFYFFHLLQLLKPLPCPNLTLAIR